ncbi:hypothetical protein RB595_000483 [Gaeumannomyces hyphopodioides]
MASSQGPVGESSRAGKQPRAGGQAEAWNEVNTLTLDGGGIRGYYSLLHLKVLMEYIKDEEKRRAEEENIDNHQPRPGSSSFHPCYEPDHVSHIAGGANNGANTNPTTHFLPCHYFDYIGGTSTGALITIMLARLRMPVDDCIEEYKTLGGKIFGNPRTFHQVGWQALVKNRKNKFATTPLEEAIQDVIRRRGEISSDQDDAMAFRTPKGLCRAIVLAGREVVGGNGGESRAEKVFLFRSYDNFAPPPPEARSSATSPLNGGPLSPLNPGQGTSFAAWKVGRAATAAKFYFKPLEVELRDGEPIRGRRGTGLSALGTGGFHRRQSGRSQVAGNRKTTVLLRDTGANRANNPAEEVKKELKSILRQRDKRIGAWVSVGTARPSEAQMRGFTGSITLMRGMRDLIHQYGDPEPVHESLKEWANETPDAHYFRFNEPNGLGDQNAVEMDEWRPRESGARTIEKMDQAFASYMRQPSSHGRFQRCARRLVDCRRRRAAAEDRSHWNRYALGTFYVCNRHDCKYDTDETWHYRYAFEQHLSQDHGLEVGSEGCSKMWVEGCERSWDYKPSE